MLSSEETLQSGEAEKYMNLIENELKKSGHDFSDSLLVPQIITILDNLSSPNVFNKTLFEHILSYSDFDVSKPIKLKDFFLSYFQVYNSMKNNRDTLAKDNVSTEKEINKLKLELSGQRQKEVVINDLITSNSKIEICYKLTENQYASSFKGIKVVFGNSILDFDVTNRIDNKAIPIKNQHQLDYTIDIYSISDLGDKKLDAINIKELLNTPLKRTYDFVEMEFLWISSMVSYLERKIALFEYEMKKSKDSIAMLNTSINQLEMVLGKYFTQIPRSQYSNIVGGTMGNELEVSEKIENLVLKAVGKEVILIWDKIVFFLAKVILLSCLLQLLTRLDAITIIMCFIIIAMENKIVEKDNMYYLLGYAISSLCYDIVYLILNWGSNEAQPAIYNKITNILVFANIIMKLPVCFSLWKMCLAVKLNEINNKHLEKLLKAKFQNEFTRKDIHPRLNFAEARKDRSILREEDGNNIY